MRVLESIGRGKYVMLEKDGERALFEGGSNAQVTAVNIESYRQLVARLFLLGREPDVVKHSLKGSASELEVRER